MSSLSVSISGQIKRFTMFIFCVLCSLVFHFMKYLVFIIITNVADPYRRESFSYSTFFRFFLTSILSLCLLSFSCGTSVQKSRKCITTLAMDQHSISKR